MIDTDKYEGHDLAKGRVGSDYNIYDRKGNIIFDADDVGSNMATLNLLADAPLLLEEVKRLREELEGIKNSMAWTVQVWWNENYMGREGWMEQMCEVYADLAKEIEAQYHGDEEE